MFICNMLPKSEISKISKRQNSRIINIKTTTNDIQPRIMTYGFQNFKKHIPIIGLQGTTNSFKKSLEFQFMPIPKILTHGLKLTT